MRLRQRPFMGCQHPSFIHHTKKQSLGGSSSVTGRPRRGLWVLLLFSGSFVQAPAAMAGMKIKKKFHCHHQNICLDDERVTTPNLMDQSVWQALTVSSGVEVPHCYYTLKSYWQCDCCALVYDSELRKNLGSPGALWTHQCSVIQLKKGALQGTEKHVRHRPDLMLLLTIQVCSLSRGDKRSCFMSAVKSMTHKEEEYLRTGWRRKLQTCFSQFSVLTPESSSRRIMICHGLQTPSMTWISGGSAGKL